MLDQFEGDYNNSKHSGIKQTPYERHRQELSCIRPAPERLMDGVRRHDFRRVKKDRAVQPRDREAGVLALDESATFRQRSVTFLG